MKSDSELMEIYHHQNDSANGYWEYNRLSHEDKLRIFALLEKMEVKQ